MTVIPNTVRAMLEPMIKANGGWVNTHAHADRSFTLSPEIMEMRRTWEGETEPTHTPCSAWDV